MRVVVSFIALFCSLSLQGQDIPLGQWRDHLSHHNGSRVEPAGDYVYCSSSHGVFRYNKNDNSLEKFSTVVGLAETGRSAIAYNAQAATLVIGYFNGNIDLLTPAGIVNVSDIKRSNIIGSKEINNIFFIGDAAYLACGFGIVVLDITKREIKDTYLIGNNGAYVNVLDLTSDSDSLYAATAEGIYTAFLNNPNLANFNSWTQLTTPNPDKEYNAIEFFNNKIIANARDRGEGADSAFIYDGSIWQHLPTTDSTTYSIREGGNKLVFSHFASVVILNQELQQEKAIDAYNLEWHRFPRPSDAVAGEEGNIWIADNYSGLVKNTGTTFEVLVPNGPEINIVRNITISPQGAVWIAPGGVTGVWSGLGTHAYLPHFKNGEWNTFNYRNIPELVDKRDIMAIAVNPDNENNIFAASWGYGLMEIKNDSLKMHTSANSGLLPANDSLIRSAGAVFDGEKNLWVTTSFTEAPLAVKKPDGTWVSFPFPDSTIRQEHTVGGLFISSNGYKWLTLPRNIGLAVFDDNGTIDDTSDDRSRKLTSAEGSGKLPTNDVNAIAEDRSGAIWLGTNKGIAVIFNPGDLFNGEDFDAKQIKLVQDGVVQLLLETESVTAIAVDGANRKWIGTSSAGVFLMSEDGTEEILHFDQSNSPLLSNNITALAIHPKTGEVFIGTDNGLISYRSTATEPQEFFKEVYAYPNPVYENYESVIAIKGLVEDTDVKITDISGQLVFSGKALGGQAIWNGKTLNGERPKTGVYLVFLSNEDGSKTHVTKILFVN